MKVRLTAATLRAIEEHRGVQGVSLRAIARDAGCSHVNAYHYADGLAGLLWLAYTVALGEFSDSCFGRTSSRKPGENFGAALARGIVDFATAREGLYRLLWFEALEGEPQGEALEAIVRSTSAFSTAAFEAFRADGIDAGEPVLRELLDILFAYLQGEVALLINGRSGFDRGRATDLVAGRAGRTWDILVASRLNSGGRAQSGPPSRRDA